MFKKIVKSFFFDFDLLICAISKVDAREGQPVSIPDTELAFAINIQLDLPTDADITAADLPQTGLKHLIKRIAGCAKLRQTTCLQKEILP